MSACAENHIFQEGLYMEENRCPQCGANVDAGAYACKYCGAPLQQAQPAQQPVQPPVQQPVQQPYAAPQQPLCCAAAGDGSCGLSPEEQNGGWPAWYFPRRPGRT